MIPSDGLSVLIARLEKLQKNHEKIRSKVYKTLKNKLELGLLEQINPQIFQVFNKQDQLFEVQTKRDSQQIKKAQRQQTSNDEGGQIISSQNRAQILYQETQELIQKESPNKIKMVPEDQKSSRYRCRICNKGSRSTLRLTQHLEKDHNITFRQQEFPLYKKLQKE